MKAANDFKAFILRGNVVDLAVGLIIGVAFGAVGFTINHSRFLVGDFINAVISFLIIAAVVFFFVVRPVNALMNRRKTETPIEATTRECPYCMSSIPMAATRCAFCTQEVPAAASMGSGGGGIK